MYKREGWEYYYSHADAEIVSDIEFRFSCCCYIMQHCWMCCIVDFLSHVTTAQYIYKYREIHTQELLYNCWGRKRMNQL